MAGGSGFIGSALVHDLLSAGHDVDVLTRSSRPDVTGARALSWGPGGPGSWRGALAGADAVVNLAGESINQKWNEESKRRILDSRVQATRAIIDAIAEAGHKPAVLVNASAVGYYGPGTEPVAEDAAPGGDFLAGVCKAWENEAVDAEQLGVRVVRLRLGVVLARQGGALKAMLLPFKLGVGGRLGSGEQWMSWIQLKDVVAMIRWAIENPKVSGAVNAVAPGACSNYEFTKAMGRVLHRPTIFPVPAGVLRTLLGEMSDMLLTGQKVLPKRAQELGYAFRFPALEPALKDCLS